MGDESEMKEAIQNFHRVYYSIEDIKDPHDLMKLHHAAEHLFDAAEIESTICDPGENDDLIDAAKNGHAPSERAQSAWKRARE